MIYYEMQCQNTECGHCFEVTRKKPTANVKSTCEVCGSVAKRYWGAPVPVHFHGAGFYVTDNDGLGIRVPDLKEHARINKEKMAEKGI